MHRWLVPMVATVGIALAATVHGCGDDGGSAGTSSSGGTGSNAGSEASGNSPSIPSATSANSGATSTGGSAGTNGATTQADTTGGASSLGRVTVQEVTTWRNGAVAAYSIIHDDACGYGLDSLFDVADPALRERGLHAGFGVIVSNCEERELWNPVNAMAEYGHEIINHSWSHAAGIPDDPAVWPTEIEMSTTVLAKNLRGQAVDFFIFPYDAFNDAVVAELEALDYLGVRAGTRGVNDAEFVDDMRIMFDAYGPDGASIYPDDTMAAYLDAAEASGGWALRELHGIDGDLWGAIPAADYLAHLDDVAARIGRGTIWMDTPTQVVRYRHARAACGLPTVSGSALTYEAQGECLTFATTVTLRVLVESDPGGVVAEQDGVVMPSRKVGGGEFYVDMAVDGGALVLAER